LVSAQLKNGHLKGLAVTASNYSTGEATTFFESSIESLHWHDRRRDSVRTCIGVPHLLASAALPLLFPPQRIGSEYFVDGSLRMTEPLRPVIKMGADRILVIGVRNETLPLGDEGEYQPGVAEIAGFTLDSLFAENLNTDIERMKQINRMLNHMNWWQHKKAGLREIKVMVIRPSQDLRVIAARFAVKLPRGIRLFLRTVGGWGHEWRLPSFLLFEGIFARELINLGYYDGLKQRPKMNAFFS
jgi:NTE family protein